MQKSKKGIFIPVNDVPNLDELLGDTEIVRNNKVIESKITDNTNAESSIPVNNLHIERITQMNQIAQVDFVWGFLFFDFPEIYHEGNKIFFNGEINKSSTNILKQTINEVGKQVLMQYHELGIHKPVDMKIELHINSPGGCISSGWDLIDFMSDFYIPIHTVATGTVASMAVMVLLAGAKRLITKNAHLLVHQFSAGIRGKRQDLIDYMKHFDDVQKQIVTYLVTYSKLNETQITEMLQYESWMNSDTALLNGFIDDVY